MIVISVRCKFLGFREGWTAEDAKKTMQTRIFRGGLLFRRLNICAVLNMFGVKKPMWTSLLIGYAALITAQELAI